LTRSGSRLDAMIRRMRGTGSGTRKPFRITTSTLVAGMPPRRTFLARNV
jgi:hypothetical protein